jgi:hypothetical protein
MSRNDEPFHIEDSTIKVVTKGAVLVASDNLVDDEHWFPKRTFHEDSEIDPDSCERGDEGTVSIQMWKMLEDELVDEDDIQDTYNVW